VWRLLLAAVSLTAVYIDPTEPSRFARLCYGLLGGYVAFSALVWLFLRFRPAMLLRWTPALLVVDILLPSALTALTSGPSSPFFVLFTFAVFSAAYRWGFAATLGTGLLTIALLLLSVALMDELPFLDSPIEANRLVIRCGYLLLLSVGVGIIAEREQILRAESAALARALAQARPEHGFRAALGGAAREVLDGFQMTTALVVLREVESGRAFLWRARGASATGHAQTDVTEIDAERLRLFLFDLGPEADAWQAVRRHSGDEVTLSVDRTGRRLRDFAARIPAELSNEYPWRTMLGSRIGVGDEWAGRVLLVSDVATPLAERPLVFLQRLCRHLEPSLFSVYLVGRLRSRIGAVERARISRELHDGVIQSLFSLQLRLETLRRRLEPGTDPAIPEALDVIQEQLHGEVLNLRDLMLQLEPPDARSGRVLELLSQRVERFSRDTGIRARFLTELTDVLLTPRLCQELTRIVQEALVNVRKHSRASNVVVQFEQRDGFWRLIVEDDGQGFDFEGRLNESELSARRAGPVVIRERVRTIGGTMTIESERGRGARLEVLVPQDRSATRPQRLH
jgi:signal transduction histidine kinase